MQNGEDWANLQLQDGEGRVCMTIEHRNGELGGKCNIYDTGRLIESGFVENGKRLGFGVK